ncbi:unnamed protein product [Lactuca virosa]|uniref:Leucine-rich repeat domain, L domain-containing protein n=1 Tax=Lactuca virosa TaxID=75947 RepID=A0AAU9M7M2_9ASTR|nr:unnamed protein product [Lactuca virosa]
MIALILFPKDQQQTKRSKTNLMLTTDTHPFSDFRPDATGSSLLYRLYSLNLNRRFSSLFFGQPAVEVFARVGSWPSEHRLFSSLLLNYQLHPLLPVYLQWRLLQLHQFTRALNEDILANELGTKATRCLQFYTEKLNPHTVIKGLGKMKELRLLSVVLGDCFRNLEFNIVSPDFPDALRYLRLNYYPYKSLPKTFQANNLVAIEMDDSKIEQLWEGGEKKVLNKLRFLDLNRSMLSTLDLGLTPNLEKLNLGECSNLVELHMPFGCLKLVSIDLRNARLRTLDLRLAPNLEKLILVECNDLEELHMPHRCLNLGYLLLSKSKLRTLDIGLTPNLKYLDLKNSYYWEELHMADQCQKLTNLDISHSKLRTLDLRLTPNLKGLDLSYCCKLVDLHTPIGCLKKLVYVGLNGCLRFKSFLFNMKDCTCCSVDESLEVGLLSKLHLIVESLERCPFHL